MNVVEGKLVDGDRPGFIPRLITVILVVLYARFGYLHGGWPVTFKVVGYCLVPLLCVWYPDLLGSVVAATRPLHLRFDDVPEERVALFGWAGLILPGAAGVGYLLAVRFGWW